jgi:hypothetical protein
MKKISLFAALVLFTGAIYLSSCSKPAAGPAGPTGPQGPAGPAMVGSISGHIDIYDQYGSQILNTKTAHAVLYSSSYPSHGSAIDSVYADSAGAYSFNNISTGFYTIAYRDSNTYGQQLHQNVEFIGGGTLNLDGKISQIPNFNVTVINADSVNHATMNVVMNCSVVSDIKQRTLLIFASNSAATSANPATYLVVASQNVKANVTSVVINIPLNNLYNAGMLSGSTVYFAIYGAASNFGSASSYEDFNTGRTIYTAITPTPFSPLPTAVLP